MLRYLLRKESKYQKNFWVRIEYLKKFINEELNKLLLNKNYYIGNINMERTKKTRIQIPNDISNEVLKLSDMTCCVCRDRKKYVQIHHIDENPANNTIDNLAVLCLQCHTNTMKGGFGKILNKDLIIRYRNEWYQMIKDRNSNLSKGIPTTLSQQCWDVIDFNNQQGIECAILGLGLNQNHVECCPKLNIFEEAIERLDLVNYVNIVGESGSGKSLTAFQLAYDFYKKGYKIYKYNGIDSPELYSESTPAVYIFDNAHLYKEQANKIQQKSNKMCKVICVYTDSIETTENDVRITSKQSVNILYDFYKNNAKDIIPIVKTINKTVGVEIKDTSFEWLINKASIEKTPYYFNYIIRGGGDYIKSKISDYKNEGFLEALAIVSIYQILSADNYISYEKFVEFITPITQLDMDNFEKKLINQDKLLVKENSNYKFSHIHTAIKFLKAFILSSYDNQIIANKYFMLLVNENDFSILGLLWYINNCPNNLSYTTQRHKYSLFNTEEINIIYQKVFERRNEPYFFSVIERMSRYCTINHDEKTKEMLLEVINTSEGEDYICIGNFINMLINDACRKDYEILDYYIKHIDIKRIVENFNESTTKDLYKFVRFFDRFSYRSKNINILLTSYLNTEAFIYKIKNCSIDDIYTLSYLSAILIYNDEKLISIRDSIIDRIGVFLQVSPLNVWRQLDNHFFYHILGYNSYDSHMSDKKYYLKPRDNFIKNIPAKILGNEIENNFFYNWQSISEFIRLICLLDEKKVIEILNQIDKQKLAKTISSLWKTDNEFDILSTFAYNQKFLLDLIKISKNDISEISINMVYWSPKGALFLYKNSKPLNADKFRNDFILTNAIIRSFKIDKDFALKILINAKDSVLGYIKRDFYHGEIGGKKEKLWFFKNLKRYEEIIQKSELSSSEKHILLNFDNYNLNKPK